MTMGENQHKEASTPITIALVGDVHDLWDEDDGRALQKLGADLVLLVGDFGNESVPVVRSIASLPMPKAAILGNHDAWYTATDWGRSKCPYDRQQEDWVQQQIDLLGEAHVGYGKLDFPQFNLTVVGGRPFSWGGSAWKNEAFYQERYGITSFEESTDRILQAVHSAAHDTIIFMGHCGPTGLGDAPEDPCGRDWKPLGGDFGDPDLEVAIAQTLAAGKSVPLVAFGHMHQQLRHTKLQLRRSIHTTDQTVYVNAAYVPRIVDTDEDRLRNFTFVTLKDGVVFQASLIWVNEDFAIQSKQVLYQQPLAIASA